MNIVSTAVKPMIAGNAVIAKVPTNAPNNIIAEALYIILVMSFRFLSAFLSSFILLIVFTNELIEATINTINLRPIIPVTINGSTNVLYTPIRATLRTTSVNCSSLSTSDSTSFTFTLLSIT